MGSIDSDFFWACAQGDMAKVKELVPRANVNWTHPHFAKPTGFHAACSDGSVEVVKFLMPFPGVDVMHRNTEGWTPLHEAVAIAHEDVVRLLLKDRRVDVDARTDQGATALWWASYYGHLRMVKMLLAGVRPVSTRIRTHEGTPYGNTCALQVARIKRNTEIATLLSDFRKDPKETRALLRKEFPVCSPAASIFAQCIFLCDGLLAVKEERKPPRKQTTITNFFQRPEKRRKLD